VAGHAKKSVPSVPSVVQKMKYQPKKSLKKPRQSCRAPQASTQGIINFAHFASFRGKRRRHHPSTQPKKILLILLILG
jgi:hypothetical protein